MSTMFYFEPTKTKTSVYTPICLRFGVGNREVTYLFGVIDSDAGPIDTWEKWKRVLRIIGDGCVYNEWGEYPAIEDFISSVETTLVDNRRLSYDWRNNNPDMVPKGITYWLCPDGFSFTTNLE